VRAASPPWASPEQQLDQESLTPASDVYALAATIYTLLAGRSPHVDVSGADRNDQLSMIDRVLHRQIPPIGRHDIPEQLERILAMAMATRVLFVCMGNICRSPMAHGVFRHQVRQAGLESVVGVGSAGLAMTGLPAASAAET